jgi:predicted nucleic acid-binding protein
MAANPGGSQLIAVDSNVLFDLAGGQDDVVDSVLLIRDRLPQGRFVIPPTVQHELATWASRHEIISKRQAAHGAINAARSLRMVPANLVSVHSGISRQTANRIREIELLPEEEVHDSLIIAESALLGCSMLLTSDEHLRGVDFERLTFELQSFDVAPPVIATPREIVRRFFH